MAARGEDGSASAEIERWFAHRGVPHYIDRYAATTDVWTRSSPLLALAYVAGGFNALDLQHWSLARNLAMSAVVVGVLVVGWLVVSAGRGRSPMQPPAVVGWPELGLFLVGPAIPSAIVGQWGDVAQSSVEGAAVLLVIYLATSYALWPLTAWAARRAVHQLTSIVGLVARALPLLLLFTAVVFMAGEIWQVAGTTTGLAYVFTLGIFFLFGSLFVLSRVPTVTRGLSSFTSWEDVAALLPGTPAESLAVPGSGPVPDAPLSWRQRLNTDLIAVFGQGLQITLVALALGAFYVVFGVLAISEATTASWTQLADVHVLVRFHLDGRTLVLTEPLLRVAGFLAAFTGMYFTVVLSTDATYREEFAEDVEPQIRQVLAVRAAYLWHRAGTETLPPAQG